MPRQPFVEPSRSRCAPLLMGGLLWGIFVLELSKHPRLTLGVVDIIESTDSEAYEFEHEGERQESDEQRAASRKQ